MRKKIIVTILVIFYNYFSAFPFKSDKSCVKSNTQEMKSADLGNGSYLNPIMAGDYPDPSILRVGDDYYITHSSMEYSPGLLIWHSKDLVNWEPLCYALTEYLGSVYAPDLIKYKDLYYIYFPAVTKTGISNWVVTAKNPAGPWSKPIDLKVGQIDPGHVVGSDDKRYLHLSDGYIVQLSDDGLSVIGEKRKVYDGWQYPSGWLVEGFCLESPKLIFHNGYYYLTVAEGGTAGPATSHMVVSSRSKSAWGPWENSPYNPIVHTNSDADTWWSKGHGTLVSTPKGDWWMVYHAYKKGFYNMGRQTLMEPVEWTNDGWFRIKKGIKVDQPIGKPEGTKVAGSMKLSDDFSGKTLGLQWRFFGEYDESRFKFENNSLLLNAKGTSPKDCAPLLCIPCDESYQIEIELEISEEATGGLVLFYNDRVFAGIGLNKSGVIRYDRGNPLILNPKPMGNKVKLRIRNVRHQVSFEFQKPGEKWEMYEASSEVSSYNHNAFGGFMSLRAGIFTAGNGNVRFANFTYTPLP